MSKLVETKTTKEEECVIFFKYKYYKKGDVNKDGSQRFVCKEKKCFSSVTKLGDEIIKMSGRIVNMEDINEELVKVCHNNNHPSFSDADIIGEHFCGALKTRVSNEPDTSIQQIYQEEQSKLIQNLQNLKVVAESVHNIDQCKVVYIRTIINWND